MLEYKEKPNSKEELNNLLEPTIKKWFFNKFKEFSLPQQYGIMEVHSRQNTLISAPTGATKTLTAFLSILNELIDSAKKGILEDKTYCIYISPLKALSRDIFANLIEPLQEMEKDYGKEFGIRIAVRTGDTTQYEKTKMLKNPPHILITTPESSAIMLSSIKFKNHLKKVDWLIIDEIHALAENKRGTHLALTVERLQRLNPSMTRIGLSATVSPLDKIAKFLVGNERKCKIINIQFIKELDVKVLSPVKDLINTSYEQLSKKTYELIDKLIQEHKTTLIFTNTRAGTERVVHYLKEKFPRKYTKITENEKEIKSLIGAHHGSLSKSHRLNIEEKLRKGQLKAIVCSTSLELGIDIGYIDLVILLGSPKSVARMLQRCLPYDSEILTSTGEYQKIGDIVENKLNMEVISFDSKKGFIKNKIVKYHKNKTEELINIKLRSGVKLNCTENHPILTEKGWKKAKKITEKDKIGVIGSKIDLEDNTPYIYELLPKNKVFVENKDNFFQKNIDKFRKENNLNVKQFSEKYKIPYSKLIDCRRLKGRKKSIRLDYFLKACEVCNIKREIYLKYFKLLKSKSNYRIELPLKPTKEIMWLAGIIAADGCIVKTKTKGESYYHIKIGNMSKKLIDKCKSIFNKYGFKCYESVRDDKFIQLECGSNLFSYLFMNLGVLYKNKTRTVEVGKLIFRMNPYLIYSYIEGIFEGDGNFSFMKNGGALLRIFSASEKFIYQLHNLMARLGYHTHISKSKSKSSKLIKNVSDIYIYCLCCARKGEIKGFFQNTQNYGDKVQRAFNLSKEFKSTIKKELIHWEDIKEISKNDFNGYVYNLTLEKEPNNFIVDDIIVHNCGRSGHQLHNKTKARIIVQDRDDLVECSVMLKNAIEKKIDKIHIPKNCLDVLAQQIMGMSLEEVWDIDHMYNIIKKSYPYKNLTRKDFNEVIDYLAGEYTTLEDRYVYAKIWKEDNKIGRKGKLARVIYMTNIGTIPDQHGILVKQGDQTLGVIDENFLEKLKRGDIFVLGGSCYEFRHARGTVAQVKSAFRKKPTVPSWYSEMLPLSFDLASDIQRFRKLLAQKIKPTNSEGISGPKNSKNFLGNKSKALEFINKYLHTDNNASEAIYNYFKEQSDYLEIPDEQKLIIEHFKDENKTYHIFHSLYGRRVNDCLSRSIAYAIAFSEHVDVEVGINDNGFYITSEKPLKINKAIKLLKAKELETVLEKAISKSEVLKRRFRHCAARSLMILRNYKGRRSHVGKQQVRSMILLSAVRRISEDFVILREAKREVLRDLMDVKNATEVLNQIELGKIKIKEHNTVLPSPFSFNLVMQGYTDILKMQDKIEFLKQMHNLVLAKISLKK